MASPISSTTLAPICSSKISFRTSMSPILSSVINLSSVQEIQACKRLHPEFLLRLDSRFSSSFGLLLVSDPALRLPTEKVSSTEVEPAGDNGEETCIDLLWTWLKKKVAGLDWQILKRWDAPWTWQRACLTMVACELSFYFTGLVRSTRVPYGIEISELGLDDQAALLFLDYSICCGAEIGVLYALLAPTFRLLPKDILRYELKEPFKLKNGWLLWAGVGFVVEVATQVLTRDAMAWLSPESEVAQDELADLIGYSYPSTVYCTGIMSVLAPLVEEVVFRGFLMVSLTKWFPTPVSVLLSSAVFALHHFSLEAFPELFVGGIVLGFSYAKTRNLLTPITMHALWNLYVLAHLA